MEYKTINISWTLEKLDMFIKDILFRYYGKFVFVILLYLRFYVFDYIKCFRHKHGIDGVLKIIERIELNK